MVLYLVNNDKIIIPLNKKESFIVKNNFSNYNEYRNQYIRKQNKKTSMDSSYNCDINNYVYQELLDITPSYKYHQNPIEYLNNSYSHHNNIENNINQNINNIDNYGDKVKVNITNMEEYSKGLNQNNNIVNEEEEENEMEENEADGVLSQMSNMSDRTKSLFKRTMDEYPPLDEDTLYEQSQNK